MKQLIVVTGGAGFIGSGVVRYLNDTGRKNIVVVDEMGQTDKWKNLVGKQFADIIEKDRFFSWLQGREAEIEAFIHLGACSSTVETDASYLLENNYRFSVRLAEYAIKHGQRFIYASSAATYGDGSKGFCDKLADELYPLNMYGYSKHLFDLWLKNNDLLDRVVGLKYFNVFGPNEGHKGRMASLIWHILPVVQKEGVIRLFKSTHPDFADGGQQRDHIYVKDAVRMTCAFLDNQATGIYNIGTGRATTWNEVAEAVFQSLGLPKNIHYTEMPKDLAGKYQNYTCADLSRTRLALGDAALCASLQESVSDYIQNHLLAGKTW